MAYNKEFHRKKWDSNMNNRRSDLSYGSTAGRTARLSSGDENDSRFKSSQKIAFPYDGNIKKPVEEEKFWSRRNDVTFIVTEELVKEMVKDEYSGSISRRLLEPSVRISEFLNNDKNIDNNLSKTLIKVILKDSKDNLFNHSFRTFLALVLQTTFATKRIDSLINVDLPTDPNMELLNLIIRFLKVCFELLPGIAYDIFYARIANILVLVETSLFQPNIDNETLLELEDLKILAASRCPQKTKIKPLDPPDDFRKISIFPTEVDLLKTETREIFLRKNIYDGSYENVDHYLDVQFRLMREDFLRPLREGVKNNKQRTNKSLTIRVYKNVQLLNKIPDSKYGIIRNIQLNKSRLTNVNWSESKRLLHGSLLCFSCDDFETLLLATVSRRNDDDIIEGILSVKFIDEEPIEYQDYTILESTNFFESYCHVLKRLQELDEESLCMKEYLIYGETNVLLPNYLVKNKCLKFRFNKEIIEYEDRKRSQMFNSKDLFKEKFIRPGDKDEIWPQAVDLHMNESQFQAFKSALTKEMTIIQGPPGTGKTYLGLLICKCLHKNVQLQLQNCGPILVVCYTNHALDQFLEGISEFTSKIVRIGGGCKSEKISLFSLKEIKKKFPCYPDKLKHLYKNLPIIEEEILFRQNVFQSFVSLNRLQDFIPQANRHYFKVVRLEDWLSGESITDCDEFTDKICQSILISIIYEELFENIRTLVNQSYEEFSIKDSKDYEDSKNEIFLKEFRLPSKSKFTIVKHGTTASLFKRFLRKQSKMTTETVNSVTSLDILSLKDRWRLYRYWRSLYIDSFTKDYKVLEDEYNKVVKTLQNEILKAEQIIMKNQDIIGMTTTGAAKYGKVLEQIGCKIIIVEEAAEVIESHVIASLNSSCQHLILIGDHKQLRPNPAVYELSKKYALDISLFERLVKKNLEYKTLSTQHRMRPEISDIMRFIYDDFHDHDSVLHYPNVPAMKSNVLFFNHFEPENLHKDILSYSNRFEVDLILKFCRHLLGNGVKGTQITILTLYSGQSYLFASLMNEGYKDVRVSVVDNYQGEENDIILLSLVRSNEYEQIGFLNIENRICVSLSRARHGLFVFGNFDILISKNKMWKKICEFLKKKDLLKKSLDMFCQNHQEKQLSIWSPNDFDKYPNFGCEEKCSKLLNCGHICVRYCHYMDKDHLQYECLVKIEKKIPFCNHKQMIECFKEVERSDCKNACERLLSCGHICSGLCRDECSPCMTKVQTICPRCGHSSEHFCHEDDLICNEVCNILLDCSHPCKGNCHTCYIEDWHDICKADCGALLTCGHMCKSKCDIYCYPCKESCPEECSHSKCNLFCDEKCCECKEQCQWKCEHKECWNLCKEMCDRDVCDERCKESVTCVNCARLFNCYGLCGEKCREVCRECDKKIKEDNLYVTLWTCGHCFELAFLDDYMFSKVEDCEITRKICPECGVIINKRSSFRYMNVVRRISKYINDVKKEIAEKIESFDYFSYCRLLCSLKPLIFNMFIHYEVDNYLVISESSQFSDVMEAQDSLYDAFYGSASFWGSLLGYKHRSSINLLYSVYKDIHESLGSSCFCPLDIKHSIARLIQSLNPNVRTFDQTDVQIIQKQIRRIKLSLNPCEINKLSSKLKPSISKSCIKNEKFSNYLKNVLEKDSKILNKLTDKSRIFSRHRPFCAKSIHSFF